MSRLVLTDTCTCNVVQGSAADSTKIHLQTSKTCISRMVVSVFAIAVAGRHKFEHGRVQAGYRQIRIGVLGSVSASRTCSILASGIE